MTNSLSDWASPIDTTITQNKNSKAKTMKNNAKKIDKHKFRKLLNDNSDSDSDSESEIADFNPPPKAEITKGPNIEEDDVVPIHDSSNYVSINNDFPKQYITNVSHPFSQYDNNNENEQLTKKLNYMINLLEEQKDEKTHTITEELILYCFLGIFVIFLIDSFVKIGKSKYSR